MPPKGSKQTKEAKQKIRIANLRENQSLETLEKRRDARLGKHMSEESKEKNSVAHMGKKQSEETTMKKADANRGKHRTEEFRKRMSDAHKNPSEETIQRMSEAQRKRSPPNEETKEKMSLLHKGHQISEEVKNKISIANTGKVRSKEVKKVLSEITREHHRNGVFDGCHKSPSKIEKMLYDFLDDFHVFYIKQTHISLGDTACIPDALIPPNIIIEADGEQHIHKCKGIWEEISKKQMKKDRNVNIKLIELGYVVFRISFFNFKNNRYKENIFEILGKVRG